MRLLRQSRNLELFFVAFQVLPILSRSWCSYYFLYFITYDTPKGYQLNITLNIIQYIYT